MKKLLILACAAVSTGLLFAAEKFDPSMDPRNSPEKKAARRLRRMKATGGYLEDRRSYKGQFLYLNSQSLVKPENVRELTCGTMGKFFMSKFDIVPSEKFEISKAKELMKKADAQGAAFLVDDPVLPALLAAPEEGWAVINVAKLNVGNPDADTLEIRVRREMWRALAYVCGCASPAKLCVMKPVSSVADLDALDANALSQYPLVDIRDRLPKMGIGAIRTVTYKYACQEGWAPPPTNEFQKAIWDAAHALPTNPIKVKFDPKKGE